jgi:endogenous inhibitor of DNA gyrase (YacG/DUF329 family)
MRCPICNKLLEKSESAAAPFCSERCRTIDLGRWLGEAYRVPAAVDPLADEPADIEIAANGTEAGRDRP